MSPFGLGIIISSSRGRGDVPWRSSYTSMYVSIWLSNHFSSYWTYYLVTNQTVRTGRDSNPRPPPWQGGILTNWTTDPKLILTHLKLHHPSHCSGWQSPRWVRSKKFTGFSYPFVHHNKYISISVVTFSSSVNYSELIVTLPAPSYLASQTELLGFIDSGVAPPSSPVISLLSSTLT